MRVCTWWPTIFFTRTHALRNRLTGSGAGTSPLGEVRELRDAADDKEMRGLFGVDVFDRRADARRSQGTEQERDLVALDLGGFGAPLDIRGLIWSRGNATTDTDIRFRPASPAPAPSMLPRR